MAGLRAANRLFRPRSVPRYRPKLLEPGLVAYRQFCAETLEQQPDCIIIQGRSDEFRAEEGEQSPDRHRKAWIERAGEIGIKLVAEQQVDQKEQPGVTADDHVRSGVEGRGGIRTGPQGIRGLVERHRMVGLDRRIGHGIGSRTPGSRRRRGLAVPRGGASEAGKPTRDLGGQAGWFRLDGAALGSNEARLAIIRFRWRAVARD